MYDTGYHAARAKETKNCEAIRRWESARLLRKMEYTEVAAGAQRLDATEQEGHHMNPNDDKLDKEVQDALNPDAGVRGDDPSDLARDPVCGNMVDIRTAPDTFTTLDGDVIYFDSADCKRLYEENPEQYGAH